MTARLHPRNTPEEAAYRSCAGDSPYLLPEYLDIVHPGWKLLQLDDHYFPLTVRQLPGLKLLEQPLLTQHFALSGPAGSSPYYTGLLEYLQQHYPYIDLCLDGSGFALPPGWKQQERVTYRLAVPDSTETLTAGYNAHHKRILKKAAAFTLSTEIAIPAFIDFLREHLGAKTRLPSSFYQRCEALLREPGLRWELYGALQDGRLVAACAILQSGKQACYQLAASSPAGKNCQAMHHLIDRVLQDRCGKGILFDFEGSMIPGLQRFYGGFGAKPYLYTRVSYNRLPWPLSRWKYGIRS